MHRKAEADVRVDLDVADVGSIDPIDCYLIHFLPRNWLIISTDWCLIIVFLFIHQGR